MSFVALRPRVTWQALREKPLGLYEPRRKPTTETLRCAQGDNRSWPSCSSWALVAFGAPSAPAPRGVNFVVSNAAAAVRVLSVRVRGMVALLLKDGADELVAVDGAECAGGAA